MKALLVASRGGHLQQLRELQTRFRPTPDEVVWVTDDGAIEIEELRGEHAIAIGAHTPTRRHVGNMVRNFGLARRLIATTRPDCVVSTGAGLAPPFMLAARLARLPALYIESATFVTAPSFSGRLTARIPGVRLRYQTISDGFGPRWERLESPFDRFDIIKRASAEVRSVFVSLGTQEYPFDRLVRAVERLAAEREIDVTWQLGYTARSSQVAGRVIEWMSAQEWERVAREADVVIGHAGTGLVLSSLRLGKVPVICARDPARGEHVDAHQNDTVRQVEARGCAVVATPETLSHDLLLSAARRQAKPVDSPPQMIELLV